ncbi:MAG: hypothetical protein R2697_06850 [Ilumatobacteraceae bacterium]
MAVWLSIGAVVGFVPVPGAAVQRLICRARTLRAIGHACVSRAGGVHRDPADPGADGTGSAFFNPSVVVGAGVVGGALGQRLRSKGFRPTGPGGA